MTKNNSHNNTTGGVPNNTQQILFVKYSNWSFLLLGAENKEFRSFFDPQSSIFDFYRFFLQRFYNTQTAQNFFKKKIFGGQ